MILSIFRKNRTIITFISLLLASIVLMIGGPLQVFVFLKVLLQAILFPFIFLAFSTFQFFSENTQNIRKIAYYRKQLMQAEQQMALQSQRLAELEELKLENKQLRDMLKNLEGISYERAVIANVVYKQPGNWSKGILVNKGNNYGLRRNDPVIGYNYSKNDVRKGIVGRVDQVWAFSSTIVPVIEKNATIIGVLSKQRLKGTLQGNSFLQDDLLRMKIYLKTATPIETGELVTTSSESLIYPRNIPIGTVVDIDYSNPRYSLLRVRPIINFNKIETVYIYSDRKK